MFINPKHGTAYEPLNFPSFSVPPERESTDARPHSKTTLVVPSAESRPPRVTFEVVGGENEKGEAVHPAEFTNPFSACMEALKRNGNVSVHVKEYGQYVAVAMILYSGQPVKVFYTWMGQVGLS